LNDAKSNLQGIKTQIHILPCSFLHLCKMLHLEVGVWSTQSKTMVGRCHLLKFSIMSRLFCWKQNWNHWLPHSTNSEWWWLIRNIDVIVAPMKPKNIVSNLSGWSAIGSRIIYGHVPILILELALLANMAILPLIIHII
jgi:hypothetical protein